MSHMLLEGTFFADDWSICNQHPRAVMSSFDATLQSMTLNQLGKESAHEEGAYALNVSVELELVDFEFVDFIVASGNYSRLATLCDDDHPRLVGVDLGEETKAPGDFTNVRSLEIIFTRKTERFLFICE